MGPSGFGTSPICIFLAPSRSLIFSMPANISGILPGSCTQGRMPIRDNGYCVTSPNWTGGKIEKLVSYLRSLQAASPELTEILHKAAAYFERNAERMRYPEFRRQHLFVGSGVIEAGCKTVIGSRLKQSGMFWTVRGANAIIALRCCRLSGRFEDYWEARRA